MFLVQHIRHFAMHTNDDNYLPAVKRQELIRQGLGRWGIDLSLDRFEGIEKIIKWREEGDPLARRVLMGNEACALPSTDTAEACLKERWTHRSLLNYCAARPGEPLNPREELLKAFGQRGARPTFWGDAKPYPERHTIERWLEHQI